MTVDAEKRVYYSGPYSWRSGHHAGLALLTIAFAAGLTFVGILELQVGLTGRHWLHIVVPIALFCLAIFLLSMAARMVRGFVDGRVDEQILDSTGASFTRATTRMTIPWTAISEIDFEKRRFGSRYDILLVWGGSPFYIRTDAGLSLQEAEAIVDEIQSRHHLS